MNYYNYRNGTLNTRIADALDALDKSANEEHARSYMDGCPENMTHADANDLLEWLDEHDSRAADAVREALKVEPIGG